MITPTTRGLSLTGLLLLTGLAAPLAQAPRAAVVAIKGGTVLTVTKGTIANGTVILRDGKIAAVGGADTAVPAGAEVIGWPAIASSRGAP